MKIAANVRSVYFPEELISDDEWNDLCATAQRLGRPVAWVLLQTWGYRSIAHDNNLAHEAQDEPEGVFARREKYKNNNFVCVSYTYGTPIESPERDA